MLGKPFNLMAWVEEHRHLLKPPVGNKCIVNGDYIVMIVGGPNERDDFHIEDGPEWFHQLEGEMVLRVQEAGAVRDIKISAGECFYLPPRVPHSPQRMAGSVGLVIERKRLPAELDGLRWYCTACNHMVYEEFFVLDNIETQFASVFDRYYGSIAHRRCPQCDHLNPAPARYTESAA
jgi:3-hydroxyanthranilate 3,4-dioxygenase